MSEPAHRSGLVAILGRPNAGKSTLLNRLLGEKLAIVSAKPQTTRSRILGILTRPEAQILLLDTPGMHAGERALNKALNEQVDDAVQDCDAALLLIDPRDGWGADHAALVEGLVRRRTPVIAALTKADVRGASEVGWPPDAVVGPQAWLRISARSGAGIDVLIAALVAALPEAAALYPEDQLSDRPLRFLAAELVREAAFDALAQELPYSLAVEIVEFDEKDPGITRIRANLVLERESQKPIVIGKGGSMIKRIGINARREIEKLLDTKVHLALWVKIEPKWQKRPTRLKSLGYS